MCCQPAKNTLKEFIRAISGLEDGKFSIYAVILVLGLLLKYLSVFHWFHLCHEGLPEEARMGAFSIFIQHIDEYVIGINPGNTSFSRLDQNSTHSVLLFPILVSLGMYSLVTVKIGNKECWMVVY